MSMIIVDYKVFNVSVMLVPTAASATVTLLQLAQSLKTLSQPNNLHVAPT
jgi:hypothetical protein